MNEVWWLCSRLWWWFWCRFWCGSVHRSAGLCDGLTHFFHWTFLGSGLVLDSDRDTWQTHSGLIKLAATVHTQRRDGKIMRSRTHAHTHIHTHTLWGSSVIGCRYERAVIVLWPSWKVSGNWPLLGRLIWWWQIGRITWPRPCVCVCVCVLLQCDQLKDELTLSALSLNAAVTVPTWTHHLQSVSLYKHPSAARSEHKLSAGVWTQRCQDDTPQAGRNTHTHTHTHTHRSRQPTQPKSLQLLD